MHFIKIHFWKSPMQFFYFNDESLILQKPECIADWNFEKSAIIWRQRRFSPSVFSWSPAAPSLLGSSDGQTEEKNLVMYPLIEVLYYPTTLWYGKKEKLALQWWTVCSVNKNVKEWMNDWNITQKGGNKQVFFLQTEIVLKHIVNYHVVALGYK